MTAAAIIVRFPPAAVWLFQAREGGWSCLRRTIMNGFTEHKVPLALTQSGFQTTFVFLFARCGHDRQAPA